MLHELEKQDDELLEWTKQFPDLFVDIDAAIQKAVRDLLAAHPNLVDNRKNRSQADPFVIALAQIDGSKVLTDEKPTASLKRPHIPDVCTALGVKCINLVELIREQGWRFV